MTNKDINDALLRRRGYTQYKGNKDNVTSTMYFFLMDASKQIFDRDVLTQRCSGMQSRHMHRMKEAYHLFFKNFFAAFTPDQIDYLLEKVDAFEASIQHHLDIAEIAMQECDNDKPIEVQLELSRVWLCNMLAGSAQAFHGECWRTGRNQPLYDPYIDRVLKASKEYARLRFGEGPALSDKQHDRVQLSVRIIANKTCEWLYNDYLEQTKQ